MSILDQHPTSRMAYHACGGTILYGGSGEQTHIYCDLCGAFSHDDREIEEGILPSGTDVAANQAAMDDGDERSPDA